MQGLPTMAAATPCGAAKYGSIWYISAAERSIIRFRRSILSRKPIRPGSRDLSPGKAKGTQIRMWKDSNSDTRTIQDSGLEFSI